ncbi:MAG TPA: CotH kinase family protein [Myxococcota bacterium]|nr:CotH kinase family protein [Myxococcota bacterium]
MRRLTLNNAVSDPSYVRQCISYSFFTDASMPAPRCSLAQVTVNGEDLGIYVNVEPIKEPMLARHFDESEGNLYEGTLSDFREGWTGTLEKKTNEGEDDWDDIDALVEAVATDDDELLSALETVLDLESFIDFWAAEVLVEHGDGYNGNTNNFYLYADPSDGRFRFIPWGTDAVFYGGGEGSEGTSVYASSMLAWRLYRHPDGQALYVERLQDMLDTHWDEGIAAERIDRMATLIEPEVSGSTWSEIEEAQEVVFDQIEARRPDIEAALADGPPEWPYEPRDSYCFVPSGSIEATFSTTWGTLQTGDPWQTGSSTLSMVFEEPMPEVEGTAVAGTSEGSALIYLPAWISDTEAVLVYFAMEEEQVAPGDVDLDLDRAIGALLYIDTETMDDFEFVAYVIGDLHFDAADSTTDAPIEGSLSGEFLAF